LRGLGGFEKPLVVKQVLPELASDPRFVEMFVREANTLVRMSHPHIVAVYELGVVDGIYFLAMEYVEGATIASILRDGPLPPPLVAQLAVQVCDALEYAHGRFGILHRDVSPRNIIVDGTGHARLLDFGVSTHIDSREHSGFGSPGYTAPEQVLGEATSVRSDLFSLGAVLFEALTGEPAFLRRDREATRHALLDEPPPQLDPQEFPERFVTLIGALLSRDPAARPASAAEVAQQLRGWLSQHAPQGVYGALVERVERARLRSRPPPSDAGTLPVTSAAASTSRTLATSPLLDEARRKSTPRPAPVPLDGTRPITGRKPHPSEADVPALEPQPGSATLPLRELSRSVSNEGRPAGGVDEGAQLPRPAPRRGWLWAATISVVALAFALVARRPDAIPSPAARSAQQTPSLPTPEPLSSEPVVVEPPPPPTPSEPMPDERAAAPAQGQLTVNALPWAELSVDGRDVGTTPLRGLKLSEGPHVLQLSCPPLGRSHRVPVVIRAGATTRVVVDLQSDPPAVQVR